jgi:hypothetical protein
MNLNVTKSPVGNGINKPVVGSSPSGMTKTVSLNYDGGINGTSSSENLSAKFKSPRATFEVPSEAKNQYE